MRRVLINASAIILFLYPALVNAHGYVSNHCTRGFFKYGDPKPNSEDNWVAERGWNLGTGVGATREDPETLPPVPEDKRCSVKAGPMTVLWQFNDAANHIGNCSALLKSTTDKSLEVSLGFQMNCARDIFAGVANKGISVAVPAIQTFDIPGGYEGKTDLYLVIKLEAQHITPFEYFSDVMDVNIEPSGNNAVAPTDLDRVLLGWNKPEYAAMSASLKMNLLAAATEMQTGAVTPAATGLAKSSVSQDLSSSLAPAITPLAVTGTVIMNVAVASPASARVCVLSNASNAASINTAGAINSGVGSISPNSSTGMSSSGISSSGISSSSSADKPSVSGASQSNQGVVESYGSAGSFNNDTAGNRTDAANSSVSSNPSLSTNSGGIFPAIQSSTAAKATSQNVSSSSGSTSPTGGAFSSSSAQTYSISAISAAAVSTPGSATASKATSSSTVKAPAPDPTPDSESSGSTGSCTTLWDTCNSAWQAAGADPSKYTCQKKYDACQAANVGTKKGKRRI